MRKIIIAFFLTCTYSGAKSQTQVFKTYKDYTDGTGLPMDSQFVKWGSGVTNFVKFKNSDDEIIRFRNNEIWGFMYKGHLFRSVGNELAMLTDSGKVNYYLNGSAGLGMLSRDDGNGGNVLDRQTVCFASVGGINEKIYRMPADKFSKLDFKQFKRDHPELEQLTDCFVLGNLTNTYTSIKKCVVEFNKK